MGYLANVIRPCLIISTGGLCTSQLMYLLRVYHTMTSVIYYYLFSYPTTLLVLCCMMLCILMSIGTRTEWTPHTMELALWCRAQITKLNLEHSSKKQDSFVTSKQETKTWVYILLCITHYVHTVCTHTCKDIYWNYLCRRLFIVSAHFWKNVGTEGLKYRCTILNVRSESVPGCCFIIWSNAYVVMGKLEHLKSS